MTDNDFCPEDGPEHDPTHRRLRPWRTNNAEREDQEDDLLRGRLNAIDNVLRQRDRSWVRTDPTLDSQRRNDPRYEVFSHKLNDVPPYAEPPLWNWNLNMGIYMTTLKCVFFFILGSVLGPTIWPLLFCKLFSIFCESGVCPLDLRYVKSWLHEGL
jgi:hypothetical protein